MYRRAMADQWGFVVQQEESKLKNKIRMDNYTGIEKVYRDINKLEFRERTGRLGSTTAQEPTYENRKSTKRSFECVALFDRDDADFLGEISRPDSEVIQTMRMSWNRNVDSIIADSAIGTVYGGEEPYVTPISLPSGQTVAVNHVKDGATPVNSHLTPWKLLKAITILEEAGIYPDQEECCVTINSKAKESLIMYAESASNDVWAAMIKSWLEGKAEKLLGLTPVMSNQLPRNVATDVDSLCVYSKTRGLVGSNHEADIKVDILPTKGHAIQIAAYCKFAVMRRHEEAVVKILCDRSV